MQKPPLKAIEAVKTGRVDGRTRRVALRFRGFFRCLDRDDQETRDVNEIVKVRLTPRAEAYWAAEGKSRIPLSS